jgi:hypothetical protein
MTNPERTATTGALAGLVLRQLPDVDPNRMAPIGHS